MCNHGTRRIEFIISNIHHFQVVDLDEVSDKHVDGNDRSLVWNKQKVAAPQQAALPLHHYHYLYHYLISSLLSYIIIIIMLTETTVASSEMSKKLQLNKKHHHYDLNQDVCDN